MDSFENVYNFHLFDDRSNINFSQREIRWSSRIIPCEEMIIVQRKGGRGKKKSERRGYVCEWGEREKRANHSVSSKKKKNKSENTGHNDNININNNDK